MRQFGFSPEQLIHGLRGLPRFWRNLATFKRQMRGASHPMAFGALYPHLVPHAGSCPVAERETRNRILVEVIDL